LFLHGALRKERRNFKAKRNKAEIEPAGAKE
jgi:hypothetical protein